MSNKWDNKTSENLFKVILSLKNIKEAKNFFRDLLTEQEIIEFAARWEAAQMLNKKISYLTISQKTGLSSTTIARVAKWLNRGLGGYQLLIKRLNANHHHPSSFGKGLY